MALVAPPSPTSGSPRRSEGRRQESHSTFHVRALRRSAQTDPALCVFRSLETTLCKKNALSLYSSVVERQSCKLKVLGSIPSGGLFPDSLHFALWFPTLSCCRFVASSAFVPLPPLGQANCALRTDRSAPLKIPLGKQDFQSMKISSCQTIMQTSHFSLQTPF